MNEHEFVDIPKGTNSTFVMFKEIELGPFMTSGLFHIEIKPLIRQIEQKLSNFMEIRKTHPKLLVLWEIYYKALELGHKGYLQSIWWSEWSDFEIKQTIVEHIIEVY